MTSTEAAHLLHEHLTRRGYPGWLTSIGVGGPGDRPAIVLFLRTEQAPEQWLNLKEWEGHPVVVEVVGEMRMLGDLTS